MDMKPSKSTNNKQFSSLITTMEENLDIARCNAISSSGHIDDFWKKLAEELNNIGPLVRNGPGWLKIWNDFKSSAMKKVQYNNRPSAVQGSGKLMTLSDLELRIAQIIDPSDYCMRPAKSQSPPIPSSTTTDPNTPSTSPAEPKPTKREKKRRASSIVSVEAESVPSKKPNTIEETMLEMQQETNKYLRRLTKIQEQRLQIEKEDLEERKKFRREITKLKLKNLELLNKKNDKNKQRK